MTHLGKIVIKENKVYFEPDGLKKPINPGIDGSFSEDINYIKDVEKHIASKQLIEVDNYYDIYFLAIRIDGNKHCFKNNQTCKAEVENNVATIIELTKK